MAFIITTTVTLPGGTLVIPELGNRTFTHPLVSYDLETEFDKDEIRISSTIQNAIDNGWITVVDDDGTTITDISVLQFNTDSIDISSITLTGYTSGTGTITPSDSILTAIQKLNGNTAALVTGVSSVNSLTGAIALTGTSNRITISGANVFDIAAPYVGQSSITTLGTIATGVWNGTTISIANGGTGQTTANSALNALLPSQAENVGKYLLTNGNNTSWSTIIGVSTNATPYQILPADPVTTTSTVGVMMGLAGTFTPSGTGNIMIIITGDMNTTGSGNGGQVQIRTGTGTAPTHSAALTGTARGSLIKYNNGGSQGIVSVPFTCNSIVSGLIPGTSYWIDISLAAITGGTARVRNITISIIEI